MNRLMRLITATSTLVVMAACTLVLAPMVGAAQNPGQTTKTNENKIFVMAQGPGDNIGFAFSEMSMDGEPIKGAPYSAQGTTTFTQTLSDGTKINRQSTGMVYRDSDGRTRREQTMGASGRQMVLISDPVAKTSYMLDPQERSARTMPQFQIQTKINQLKAKAESEANAATGTKGTTTVTIDGIEMGKSEDTAVAFVGPDGPPPPPGVMLSRALVTMSSTDGKGPNVEQLGTQTFDGVQAEGTRTTSTIPAGTIGNDRPIQTVSEVWYSKDLHVVVMSKRSDPWMGETVFQLSNISRTEPSSSLFEVPADYTVKEGPARRAFYKSSFPN